MTVTYTVGDTREVIKGIADGSVDLIASSPPFLALRSYVPADHESKGDEIGSEANPAEFVDMLLGLTAEWGRVLAAHGSLAIELGDTYSGSGGAGGDYNEGGLRDGQNRADGSARRANKFGTDPTSNSKLYTVDKSGNHWPRAKSLALIPQLYAVALAYGLNPLTGAPSPAGRWLVRNVIVWHRPNPAVGALGDKVRPSTSYIVVATRSAKRWFDLTAVRGTLAVPEAATPAGARKVSENMAANPRRGDYGQNVGKLIMSNPAGAPPLDAWFDEYDTELTPPPTTCGAPYQHDPHPVCAVGNPKGDFTCSGANPYDGSHDTWTLTTQPSRLAHYAMWPAKLAERLVLSMCPREVCRECGTPRRRVERTLRITDGLFGRGNALAKSETNGATFASNGATERETIGWTDCGCFCYSCRNGGCPVCLHSFRPGLVLDPFAGSGTTLAVADLHGRDAIGIDFDARNKAIYPARYDEVKKSLYGTPAPMPGQETFDFAI